ncbi:hypothetical protein ACWGJ9_14915 [Curtobacterium citreum]
MAQRGPTRPTARIEEAIGFAGTFGVLFLGVTVFCEVTGRPALGWAMTLLVCVFAVVVLDRWRVSVLRRHAAATGVVDGIGAAGPAGGRPGSSRTGVDRTGDDRAASDRTASASAPASPAAVGTRHVADATHGADG